MKCSLATGTDSVRVVKTEPVRFGAYRYREYALCEICEWTRLGDGEEPIGFLLRLKDGSRGPLHLNLPG